MYVKRAGKWHCTRIVCGYTAARNLNFPRVQSGNITADYLQRDLAAGSGRRAGTDTAAWWPPLPLPLLSSRSVGDDRQAGSPIASLSGFQPGLR